MEDIEIRNNFARNIANLRKSKKMNQAEFAKTINYSDKAISKWETGETMPDVFTMKTLAEYFNVTIDDLISEKDILKAKKAAKNHLLVIVLSMGLCVLIGLIVYATLEACSIKYSYLGITSALVASCIVLLVFTAIWFSRIYVFVSISLLIWTVTLSSLMMFDLPINRIIIVGIATLLDLLFGLFLLIERKDKRKEEK